MIYLLSGINTMKRDKEGFTLIEILVVIGLIAILAAIVLIAINPARQFAQGRDTQRDSNLNSILNAIGQRMADNKGVFAGVNAANGITCPTLATGATTSIVTAGAGTGDLSCLVPTYLPAFPTDPDLSAGGSGTGYAYFVDASTGRVRTIATTTEPSIPRNADMFITR